jgi:hypothetical protein
VRGEGDVEYALHRSGGSSSSLDPPAFSDTKETSSGNSPEAWPGATLLTLRLLAAASPGLASKNPLRGSGDRLREER